MLTRREAFVALSAIGLIAGIGKAFGQSPAVSETYILPVTKTVYVKPGQRELKINIPLQLVYNSRRSINIAVSGLEIITSKAVSRFPRPKSINVSPKLVRTDRNGLANWNATIPLSGFPEKNDEIIVISPYFRGKGNLGPSPVLSTVTLYIKYRK
jgi:hypothetical protein